MIIQCSAVTALKAALITILGSGITCSMLPQMALNKTKCLLHGIKVWAMCREEE